MQALQSVEFAPEYSEVGASARSRLIFIIVRANRCRPFGLGTSHYCAR